ncbi:MAG: hypothetical protein DCF26_09905 [Burkholderiales bacterium]|nr:MAG: hypothetical protein DCF26_09905 [Burkholderiales bacterium]
MFRSGQRGGRLCGLLRHHLSDVVHLANAGRLAQASRRNLEGSDDGFAGVGVFALLDGMGDVFRFTGEQLGFPQFPGRFA